MKPRSRKAIYVRPKNTYAKKLPQPKDPRQIDWVQDWLEQDQAAFDTLRVTLHGIFEGVGPEAVAEMNRLLDNFVELKLNKRSNDND